MKVLLTGGTGYLGEHLLRALSGAGHEVRALVRDAGAARHLQLPGVSLVPGDVTEAATWLPALPGADAVVHAAGLVLSWARDRSRFEAVNVQATLALVDAARDAGIPRILATGSLFALGPSGPGEVADESRVGAPRPPLTEANEYVFTKRRAAEALWERQRGGHPVTVAYPTILLGPGRRTAGNHTALVIDDIRRRRFPGMVGDGRQVWNLVAVEQVAEGYLRLLERWVEGENYILGGENWTQEQFVTRAAAPCGVPNPRRRLGTALPLALAAAAEGWAALTGRPPFLTRGAVRLYDANWAFDSAKAQAAFGYRPGDVDAAVARTVTWLQDAAPSGTGGRQ